MSKIAEQISREVNKMLDDLMQAQRPLESEAIASAIVAAHNFTVDPADTENKAVFEWGIGIAVRAVVRACINRRAGDCEEEEADPQFILPGFTHVRQYYIVRRLVERDGKRATVALGVPISDMSDAEIVAKEKRYDRSALTSIAHADDLRRFRRERRAEAKARGEIPHASDETHPPL